MITSLLFVHVPALASVMTSDTAKADPFDNNYQESVSDKKASGLSRIEDMFNTKDAQSSGNVLRQAGYDLFGFSGATGATGGKFDGNYKLSIGEKVNVYLYGAAADVMAMSGSTLLNPRTRTEVDSKGNIFVQGIGLVQAENRTVSEVEASIARMASGKYRNLQVKLTVASGQEFSVFVYGHVAHPGKVIVGNNSSVFDALNAAGGVKKTGTLRNIKYVSYGKTKYVDLYKMIFTGNDDNIIVRPNDKIFVGEIGKVIALKNGVATPAIYEVKDGETLQYIAKNYAGGLLPLTQTNEVTLSRIDSKLKQRSAVNISWDEAQKTQFQSGDAIEFRKLYNDTENVVVLQGNIKHPATYAYKEGMRLSDILKSEDELLEETFITQAVIRRVSGKDNTVENIPVFLKEFFSGMNDPVLKPKDVISIYKNTNSKFVDIYGCIDSPRHLTYSSGMTLKDAITNIKFIESDVTGLELESNNTQGVEKPVALQGTVEENDPQLLGNTTNSNSLIPTENIAVEITSASGDTSMYYLYDIMINSDRIKTIKLAPDDKVFFRPLRSNEIMKKVKVSGFVNTPGVFTFVEGKKLVDMIEMAGGLSKDADMRGVVFLRNNIRGNQINLAIKNNKRDVKLLEGRLASGYKQASSDQQTKLAMIKTLQDGESEIKDNYNGQISLNISSNDLDKLRKSHYNIEVQDGDDIYVPRIPNHVSVIGEVYNEQSFIYKDGAKAKYYIKEVGGYTPNANKFRIYKVGVNGSAEKIRMKSAIKPGDTIVVPRRIAGNDWITPICQTLQSMASIVVMAFAVTRWK